MKNIQFTRLIKVNGQLREFNFRKSNATQNGFFSVDVSDARGARITFKMERQQDTWMIVTPELPEWVADKQTIFNEIIMEELK